MTKDILRVIAPFMNLWIACCFLLLRTPAVMLLALVFAFFSPRLSRRMRGCSIASRLVFGFLALALVSGAYWGYAMSLRRTHYILRAIEFQQKEVNLRGDEEQDRAHMNERTDRLRALAYKYRRAADSPWLPLAPDPPAPR